ncbi:Alpha/beta hydrolase, related [Balamuthia mandrillaris]
MEGGLSFSGISGGYQALVDAIVRPPRFTYDVEDLGPARFRIGRRRFQRTDLRVTNERGHALQLSHYEPLREERPFERLPCVIYLHGNCGSRMDALDCIPILLPYNITLLSLDFSGSGISEGEYVSLGYFEKDDLASIVQHLRDTGTVSRIGLWGRSMGAATSLLYGQIDPSIACMVLDSPFSSLTKVAKELVESAQVKIPKMMVNLGLRMIRKTILSKVKFDINKLEPIAAVESCFIPALFAHGKDDTFIGVHHSNELYAKYAGDKNLILVEGDHNSARPRFFFDSVTIFFHNMLLTEEEQRENENGTGRKKSDAASEPLTNNVPDEAEVYNRPRQPLEEPTTEELEEEMLRQAIFLSLQEQGSDLFTSTTQQES